MHEAASEFSTFRGERKKAAGEDSTLALPTTHVSFRPRLEASLPQWRNNRSTRGHHPRSCPSDSWRELRPLKDRRVPVPFCHAFPPSISGVRFLPSWGRSLYEQEAITWA